MDLKWTFSTSKYMKMLKEERSIQLALYAKLLQSSSAITAYFLLSDGCLCTCSDKLFGKGITRIELLEDSLYVNERIIKKTLNSYDYRQEELKEGKIELAEDMTTEHVQYHIDTAEKDLIPLEGDGKIKKINPYSNYELFKGMIK